MSREPKNLKTNLKISCQGRIPVCTGIIPRAPKGSNERKPDQVSQCSKYLSPFPLWLARSPSHSVCFTVCIINRETSQSDPLEGKQTNWAGRSSLFNYNQLHTHTWTILLGCPCLEAPTGWSRYMRSSILASHPPLACRAALHVLPSFRRRAWRARWWRVRGRCRRASGWIDPSQKHPSRH